MLALRLTRAARLAVQLRRLTVAAASAGTGFLLLCALGHALAHPDAPGDGALRLAWCAAPLAATAYLAVAVARTDPGTRPRPGLSAIGLGPGRLMAVSVVTTALSAVLGSLVALLVFLHLRGDLAGLPFDGDAADSLAAGLPLPAPATATLLALVPATACAAVALALRPTEPRRPAPTSAGRRFGRFGAYGWGAARETFGTYGRYGARLRPRAASAPAPEAPATMAATEPAGAVGTLEATLEAPAPPAPDPTADPAPAPAPRRPQGTGVLPWGVTVLAAGLAVETYAGRSADPAANGVPAAGVLVGWALTALGLALAGPGLTHLCGRLVQAVRPGALRLLAGRMLMEESGRLGRPLGVVCAVASAAWAATVLYDAGGPPFGPLGVLGGAVVAGCTVAALLTAAVEARQERADTTQALVRLGAPPRMLRTAAAVRAGALLALFGPLTVLVAALAALPLAR
ncbi:hypothetical protein ACGFZL_19005 [Streptomyces sp. NPDC048182]|uniref:hypothetical protein n=1 Tax=Streptomyces sp. NPDC048182 TaxID=3365507 RepID=UPI00371E6C33